MIKQYKNKSLSERYLRQNGFSIDSFGEDRNEICYKKVIPLKIKRKNINLIGIIRVFFPDKLIKIEVETLEGYPYAPYYTPDFAHRDFVSKVERSLKKELNKLENP